MKIAIAGTRGIPNYYGGFEQCASILSVMLAQRGHEVIVYNSHDHPYKDKNYRGVTIRHCYNPEKSLVLPAILFTIISVCAMLYARGRRCCWCLVTALRR